MGEAAGCTDIIKAFIALVFGHTELSNFNHSQGYSNDRRLSGMITIGTGVCASICHAVISYGVRLRVARSTVMGNAKALCGGTSIRYGSHAFFHLIKLLYIHKWAGGSNYRHGLLCSYYKKLHASVTKKHN